MFGNKNKNNDQRRQVITSQPASVFSYHASRSQSAANLGRHEVPTERIRSKIKWHTLPSWIAAIAIVVSILYCATLTSTPRVVVSGGVNSLARPSDVYQNYASSVLRSSVLNKTKPTINTDAVAAKIQAQYPEIDAVSVTIPLAARRPVVRIEVSPPVFIINNNKGDLYYVRTDGTVSAKLADVANPPKGILTVVDQSGLAVNSGKLVLPKDTVSFISEVIRQLRAKHITISQLTLPVSPSELQVRIAGAPYYIKFNVNGDARLQAGAFLAVKQKLEGDHITPKEYIDVRVEERAYYK